MSIMYNAGKMCIMTAKTIEDLDALATKFGVLYMAASQLTEDEYLDLIGRINTKKAQIQPSEENTEVQ